MSRFRLFNNEISSLSGAVCLVVTTGICTVSLPPKNPAIPFFFRVTVRVVVCVVTVGFDEIEGYPFSFVLGSLPLFETDGLL